MKHIKLFENFDDFTDEPKVPELNTVAKVIKELGDRGHMKEPLAKFVFDNAERFGIDPAKIEIVEDFPEKIADLIGYYLMDGEEFWNDWVEITKAK